MDFRAEYEKWCTDPYFDEATKAELKACLLYTSFGYLVGLLIVAVFCHGAGYVVENGFVTRCVYGCRYSWYK